VADYVELWKLNNIFKTFLLSFVLAFLASSLIFHNILVSRYLIIALVAGVGVYVAFGALPLLKKKNSPLERATERRRFPKTTVIGILVIILLFATAFIIVRNNTAPMPGYPLISSQFLILPNGTALAIRPTAPNNECAWLESMNITTQQKVKDLGLPDCDFAWPHINLSQPTLFTEFENFTEFAYIISPIDLAPGSMGTAILCFTVPAQSFQCWVPPARVSHLR